MNQNNMFELPLKENWKVFLTEFDERKRVTAELNKIIDQRDNALCMGYSALEVQRKYNLSITTLSLQLKIKDEILTEMINLILCRAVPEETNPILN